MRTIVIAVLALCAMACVGPALAADAQTLADRQALKHWTNAETRAQGEKDSGMSLDHAQKVVSDWKTELQSEIDSGKHPNFWNDGQIAALDELEQSLKGIMVDAERKNTQAVLDQQAVDAAREALDLAEKGLAKDAKVILEDIRKMLAAERYCQLTPGCSDKPGRTDKIKKILDLYAKNFKISCEPADIVKTVVDVKRAGLFLANMPDDSDTALDRAVNDLFWGRCQKFKILVETSGSGQNVDLGRCVQPVALDVTTRVLVTFDSVEKVEGQVTYWGSGKADHVVTKYTHAIHSCGKGDGAEPIIAKSSEPMEIRLRLLPNTTNDLEDERRFQVDIKPGRINMTWKVITSFSSPTVNYEWWDEMWKSHYKGRAAGGYYRFEVLGKITATKVGEGEFSGAGSYVTPGQGIWAGTEKTKITIERIAPPATVKPTIAQPANVQPARPK